jgi:hypothetical protein
MAAPDGEIHNEEHSEAITAPHCSWGARSPPRYKGWFEEIGFKNVVEKNFYWPTSPWARGNYFKQCAMYCQEDLLSGLEAMSLKVMALLGWKEEQIEAFGLLARG